MKKSLIYILLTILFLYSFYSCQKEIYFDFSSTSAGSLNKDNNGNCLPVTVGGTYIAGKNVSDTNYIQVEVNVTKEGSYEIKTDSVNGFSFKAMGTFTSTGATQVKLIGSGKPTIAGTNNFIISYNNSTCNAIITVQENQAVFTLQGAPDACTNALVSGGFVRGSPLDTSNTVAINVVVSSPGSYFISTNTVNGYSFSTSGSFAGTGTQTIRLTATGTPVDSGVNVFTVTAGNAGCTFPVTVLSSIIATNNDHFPLTDNSYWVYDDLYHPGDSLTRKIIDTISFSGHQYKAIEEQQEFASPAKYYYRKTGSDYFEYAQVDKYTNSFQYGKPVLGDLPFLKENLSPGDNWMSDEYQDTASFGQIILLRYQYYCIDTNATVVLNGRAFTHVYKIDMKPQIRAVGNAWGFTSEVYNYYYAKGIGLIYKKRTSLGFREAEIQIRRWQVN